MKSICLLAAVAAMWAPSVYAQGLTAQISGAVQDQVQAAVPNAKVELVSQDTAARWETITDDNGAFLFPQLLRGIYKISISTMAFAASNRPISF